jgi:3alpha(or 20beta)-hydroxysteroid dehydrogenase
MNERRRFEGQVVLVTGAARGMGAAHVRRFAAEGATVVLADVRDEPGEAVAAELREAGHAARYAHLDVTHGDRWKRWSARPSRQTAASTCS